jgi:CDP-diacylglycerol--serine O-phosphatidyltransferase
MEGIMKKIFPVLQHANIPNVITTLGLCFGVAACFFLYDNNLRGVLLCMFFASLMDLIDGFAAIKFNQQTNFGIYADTLVDFFICNIMPVLIAFVFVGNDILLMCGLGFYCVCGMWRLANYIIIATEVIEVTETSEEPGMEKRNYYTGLPVPSAMLLVALAIWGVVQYSLPVWLCILAFFLTGLLMISSIKFRKYGFVQKSLWGLCLAFFAVIIVS